jgi:hypothetical protein
MSARSWSTTSGIRTFLLSTASCASLAQGMTTFEMIFPAWEGKTKKKKKKKGAACYQGRTRLTVSTAESMPDY